MEFSHRLITPPEIEPLTVDEVRLHTRIDHTIEDDLLASWITAGRRHAETYQRRAYINQVWEYSLDCFPSDVIFLPRAPLQQVLEIYYIDSEGVSTTIYNTHETDYTTTTTYEPDVLVGEDDFIIDTAHEPGRISLAWGKSWPSELLQPIRALVVRYISGYGREACSVPDTVKDAIQIFCAYRYENRVGEAGGIPAHFYDILRPERMYTP